jgi:hypothetical protein
MRQKWKSARAGIGSGLSIWRSWRVDETYVKVKGRWVYLYRAVDKRGWQRTRDLPAPRNRFFGAAIFFLFAVRGGNRDSVDAKIGKQFERSPFGRSRRYAIPLPDRQNRLEATKPIACRGFA